MQQQLRHLALVVLVAVAQHGAQGAQPTGQSILHLVAHHRDGQQRLEVRRRALEARLVELARLLHLPHLHEDAGQGGPGLPVLGILREPLLQPLDRQRVVTGRLVGQRAVVVHALEVRGDRQRGLEVLVGQLARGRQEDAAQHQVGLGLLRRGARLGVGQHLLGELLRLLHVLRVAGAREQEVGVRHQQIRTAAGPALGGLDEGARLLEGRVIHPRAESQRERLDVAANGLIAPGIQQQRPLEGLRGLRVGDALILLEQRLPLREELLAVTAGGVHEHELPARQHGLQGGRQRGRRGLLAGRGRGLATTSARLAAHQGLHLGDEEVRGPATTHEQQDHRGRDQGATASTAGGGHGHAGTLRDGAAGLGRQHGSGRSGAGTTAGLRRHRRASRGPRLAERRQIEDLHRAGLGHGSGRGLLLSPAPARLTGTERLIERVHQLLAALTARLGRRRGRGSPDGRRSRDGHGSRGGCRLRGRCAEEVEEGIVIRGRGSSSRSRHGRRRAEAGRRVEVEDAVVRHLRQRRGSRLGLRRGREPPREAAS